MRILSVHRKLSVLERCPSERLVCMERCPYGEVSVWGGARMKRCSYGEMAVLETCPYGEVSVLERFPYGEVSVWRGVRMERCPYYKGVHMERFDCTVLLNLTLLRQA